MARHAKSYSGEHRSVHLGVQLTPSERQALAAAAENAGTTLSQYVRELCLRRSESGATAGVRRNPEAKALMRQLSAIGNNLNQLSRRANTHGVVPGEDALLETLDLLKAAMARVIAP